MCALVRPARTILRHAMSLYDPFDPQTGVLVCMEHYVQRTRRFKFGTVFKWVLQGISDIAIENLQFFFQNFGNVRIF